MKTRLAIFLVTLLIMPLAGFWVGGSVWNGLSPDSPAVIVNPPATLLTTLFMVGYVLFANHSVSLLSGNNPLKVQRNYFLWTCLAGTVLVWSLAYLNLYAGSWVTQPENPVMQLLLYSPLFALLAPAVLITRSLLGSVSGLLKMLSHGWAVPAPTGETLAITLFAIAAGGLLGGASWPAQLIWLFWLAPLLLLVALQILWHESTIFSGLTHGDWGRVVLPAASGVVVANVTLLAYRINGGIVEIFLPHPLLAQFGYAAFGLLCMQLGDVIAENWRGKKRSAMFQQKKKFPIPVVSKK
ncbi:MAG: hypothetical protein WA632_00895 [Gallionella sp.]